MFMLRQHPEEDISQCDSFLFSFFFSSETEQLSQLAVELVTRLEMLIVRHARCHLAQQAAHDSPRRCLRVTCPVG